MQQTSFYWLGQVITVCPLPFEQVPDSTCSKKEGQPIFSTISSQQPFYTNSALLWNRYCQVLSGTCSKKEGQRSEHTNPPFRSKEESLSLASLSFFISFLFLIVAVMRSLSLASLSLTLTHNKGNQAQNLMSSLNFWDLSSFTYDDSFHVLLIFL